MELEFIQVDVEGSSQVAPEVMQSLWRVYEIVARGGGWSELFEMVQEQTQGLLSMKLSGCAVVIWQGPQEFYDDLISSAQMGHLACILARDAELERALRDRGQVVVRRRVPDSWEVFLPIGEDEFQGVLVLQGAGPWRGAEVEWGKFLGLVQGPVSVLIERRCQQKKIESLQEENRYFRERERRHYLFKDLVCESEVMRRIYDALHERVGDSDPLWMTGEAGTGKELLARALHHLGERAEGMLIRLDCAEFGMELVDYELFGCVANELTGAVAPRKGIFELAEGGTVFLHEVDRLSPMIQGKLVRVLKEREVRRIGDAVGRAVNARVICSSHRDVEQLCRQGSFRRDLWELLKPFQMEVPSLRERRADILPLARIFMRQFVERYDARCRLLDGALERWLESYSWPGNVRQLQTLMETSVLMAKEQEVIGLADLALEAEELADIAQESGP